MQNFEHDKDQSNRRLARISPWSEIWELVSLSLLYLGFIAICFVVLGFFIKVANASEAGDELPIGLHQVSQGALLFKTENGVLYHQAPTVETDVEIVVTGMIARAKVKQRFENHRDQWLEGIYVFPLPENAAVDQLRMQVGDRIIEGQIKERAEAKKMFEAAKAEGKKASLLEQERPNLFTNSVANIGPRESITVEIEYQHVLHYDSGNFRLRFPMAITPRYISGQAIERYEETTSFQTKGWAMDTDEVQDASRITPAVLPAEDKRNPVRLKVILNSGFPLSRVDSSYHPVNIENTEAGQSLITLAEGSVASDRDFELVWQPEIGNAPQAALFSEHKDGAFYHLVMVMPPDKEVSMRGISREVIYVIDISGSMSGVSIEQARHALSMALDRLQPTDRFNVVAFNNSAHRFYANAQPASLSNIRHAKRYVANLSANGGTNIRAALEASLLNQTESAAVRQVVFITDGSVGNEAALFGFIQHNLGNSRLFTIGIGSAPNSYFMSKAAQFGRGTFTYIGNVNEVQLKMDQLFQKLETAVMTEVNAEFEDPNVEMWPKRLPDLYQGEPLIFTAKTSRQQQRLVVSGKREHQHWRNTMQLSHGSQGEGIATLWARDKVASLMDRMHEGEPESEIKPEVIKVAIDHHLVSKYTSLVAVDVTPSRPSEAELNSEMVPVNLPHGQNHEAIFGRHAQTATAAQLNLLLGLLLLTVGIYFSNCFKEPLNKCHCEE